MRRRIRSRSVDRWLAGKIGAARLVGLTDSDRDELLFRASERFARGEIADAAKLYDLALTHWPGSADALIGAGACRQLEGDVEGAIGFYDRALAARRDDAYALANRAECLILTGRRDEADETLTSISTDEDSLKRRIALLRASLAH